MGTYVNNLRLLEITTGDESGTWGTKTNTNLELIGEAFGYGTEALTTNADTQTITMADGASDGVRALFLKITGALDSNCTITLAPNTVDKIWIVENATTDSGSSGPYSIIISQGSGANVTIANGKNAVIYTDGAGAGAAVVDALTDLAVSNSLLVTGTTPTLTIGDAGAEDTKIVFDGNAKDFYVALDDSADKLVIGEGSTVGTNNILTITDDTVTIGDAAAVDTSIVFDGNAKDFYVGLDDSADKLVIGEGSTVGTNNILTITDDTVILGDGAAADTAIVYDGNAKDFYIGLDDSADKLVVGEGSTVGTNNILTLTDDSVTVGDGAAVDTSIVYDGNAKDFYIGLDDSADELVIGEGSTVGTNSILTLTDDSVTIGDGAAVDTKIVFDGAAQDYYIGIDDGTDDLMIGLGSTMGTTPMITMEENQYVVFPAAHVTIGDGTAEDTALFYNGNAQDFYIGLDDSLDDLTIGLGNTVGSSAILSMDEDQHISLQPAKRLYFDGFGNTYLAESSSDVLMVTVGGTDRWKFSGGNFLAQADDNNDIGAPGATRPRDVYVGSTVYIGDNPSAYGDIRLKKDFILATRNNANDANKVIISENVMTGNDTMDIGDNTKWAAIRFHCSTVNVMELTQTAINLNKAVTASNAAFKLTGLATSDPGVAGQLWNDSNTVKISAG